MPSFEFSVATSGSSSPTSCPVVSDVGVTPTGTCVTSSTPPAPSPHTKLMARASRPAIARSTAPSPLKSASASEVGVCPA